MLIKLAVEAAPLLKHGFYLDTSLPFNSGGRGGGKSDPDPQFLDH